MSQHLDEMQSDTPRAYDFCGQQINRSLSIDDNIFSCTDKHPFNRNFLYKKQNIAHPEKYVGFADLPNQIYRYCSITGFDFNLMVVGESGLGKSTFINNLFCSDVYVPAKYSEKCPPIVSQTLEIRQSSLTLTENGVPLRLNIIDTPGFGDCINNSESWGKIVSYINKRNEEYFSWENSSKRVPINDMRVHCCIYFISPTGHKLKPLDLDILSKLQEKVNIIPVIAKSDTLTPDDLVNFKNRIMTDLKDNNIKFYDFPEIVYKDVDDKDTIEGYLKRVPFAIVSSDFGVEINGKFVRCRKYPWGICEIENLNHCDFVPLRNLLLRTCTAHLIEHTHMHLYEKYRSLILSNNNYSPSDDSSPLELIEQEKQKQNTRLEQLKQEYQNKYFSAQNDFKIKLDEKDRMHKSKIAELESEFAKLCAGDGVSVGDASKTSKESDDKKKDKKKRMF